VTHEMLGTWHGHAHGGPPDSGLAGSVAVDAAGADDSDSVAGNEHGQSSPASARSNRCATSVCSGPPRSFFAAERRFVKNLGRADQQSDQSTLEGQIGAPTRADSPPRQDNSERLDLRESALRLRVDRHRLPRVRHGRSQDPRGHRGRRVSEVDSTFETMIPELQNFINVSKRCQQPTRRRHRATSTTSPARSAHRITSISGVTAISHQPRALRMAGQPG